MNNNKTALVVIVYGKALEDALTIQSLLGFERKLDHLLIVNNGPTVIDENSAVLSALAQKHHHVVLENQVQNKPLSWIYNDFIQQYDADYYVLFDDDTEINIEYQNILFTAQDIDIELPKIISMSDNVQYYPLVNGAIEQKDGIISNAKEIFSIGSGLVISKGVKLYFIENKMELFDSHFALYGVDFSFFRKINCIEQKSKVFNISSRSYINHSLSRAEKEISEWREKERLYDLVLTLKYYYSYAELRILKLFFKKILGGKMNDALLVLRTAFNGAHPRCISKVLHD
ncbi:glycosyltransferase family 2 protein [Acinetobacter pittii]|uniref:glycosyltransferase family 2 protein n=1 Tax=Acinetobacter pittii TaxID=48296 RepID=UPI00031B9C88|nr:glycosyltransferase [Acinetobacter pittii]MCF1282590.1 glycosyltransferase [Acinetobacter pittii]MCU4546191.1 glycosyltransferase [Acinetobacter pittii]OTT12608.1 glycosyl transferase [Acinetobacter pittii]OTT39932.1 glycosyl transferase [Acinetobacter pittii]SSP22955.1 glycosyl transferase [Acinetobacter pittii]